MHGEKDEYLCQASHASMKHRHCMVVAVQGSTKRRLQPDVGPVDVVLTCSVLCVSPHCRPLLAVLPCDVLLGRSQRPGVVHIRAANDLARPTCLIKCAWKRPLRTKRPMRGNVPNCWPRHQS
jgi:hypothetical protein